MANRVMFDLTDQALPIWRRRACLILSTPWLCQSISLQLKEIHEP